jgi:hypothetical protein
VNTLAGFLATREAADVTAAKRSFKDEVIAVSWRLYFLSGDYKELQYCVHGDAG